MAGTVSTSKLAPSKELAIISGLAKGLSTRKKELEAKEMAEQENKIKMADKMISMLKGERAYEMDVRKQNEIERSNQATEEIALKSAQISMENSKASTMKILNDMMLNDPENKLAYEKAIKEIEYDYDIKGYKVKDAVDKRTFGYEQNIQQAGKLEMAGVESELGMRKLGVEQQGREKITGMNIASEEKISNARIAEDRADRAQRMTIAEMNNDTKIALADAKDSTKNPRVKAYFNAFETYTDNIGRLALGNNAPDETSISLFNSQYDNLIDLQGQLLTDPNISDDEKISIRSMGSPVMPVGDVGKKRFLRKDIQPSLTFTNPEPTTADTGRGLVQSNADSNTVNEWVNWMEENFQAGATTNELTKKINNDPTLSKKQKAEIIDGFMNR